jgi:predicted aspartyl protease
LTQGKFPFTSDRRRDFSRPLMLIEIHSPVTGRMLRTRGLIDTGADECVFPSSFAELLGIDLEAGAGMSTVTAGGVVMRYVHPIVLKTDRLFHGIVFPQADIGFMNDLHFPLLGVKSFLSYFMLQVDYENEAFSLAPNLKCLSLAKA